VRTVSGASFVGSKTVTVVLSRGRWFFSPNGFGRKSYFAVVA
jgi:hypothetical protein